MSVDWSNFLGEVDLGGLLTITSDNTFANAVIAAGVSDSESDENVASGRKILSKSSDLMSWMIALLDMTRKLPNRCGWGVCGSSISSEGSGDWENLEYLLFWDFKPNH